MQPDFVFIEYRKAFLKFHAGDGAFAVFSLNTRPSSPLGADGRIEGLNALLQNMEKRCRLICQRDSTGAALWIDSCPEQSITGDRQLKSKG